jgi:hypothetical protein
MIIICPYTDLDPRTERAVRDQAPHALFIHVEGLFGYWCLLNQFWTGQDDLVVIEHDMNLRGGEIASFRGCNEPWCTFRYPLYSGHRTPTAYGLGCVRFSDGLQRATEFCGQVPWPVLDLSLFWAILGATGQQAPHVHGETGHYHGPRLPGVISVCSDC